MTLNLDKKWYRKRPAHDWVAFVGCLFAFFFATASVLHALDPPTRVFLPYQESVTVSDRTGSNCGECTWSIQAEGIQVSTLPVFTLTVPSIDFGNVFTVVVTGTETSGSGSRYVTIFQIAAPEETTTTTTVAPTTTTTVAPTTTTTVAPTTTTTTSEAPAGKTTSTTESSQAPLVATPTTVAPALPIVLPTRGSAVTVFKTRVSARVFFGLRSSDLTPQAKRTLSFAVSKIPKNGTLEIEINGAVQDSSNKSYIVPLSTRRAQSVKKYLGSLHIRGKYKIRIMGVVGETPKVRRADTTLIYS